MINEIKTVRKLTQELNIYYNYLEKNNLKVNYNKMYEIIKASKISYYTKNKIFKKFINNYFQKFKDYFNPHDLSNLLNEIKTISLFDFFNGNIDNNLKIKSLILNKDTLSQFKKIDFKGCTFDEIIIDDDLNNLENIINMLLQKNIYKNGYEFWSDDNIVHKVKINNMDSDSWKVINEKRLFNNMTFRTNLYFELDRVCNAKCKFCRNDGLEKKSHKFSEQLECLEKIYENLDNVFVGGGEPTLHKQKLELLKSKIIELNNKYIETPNIYIFTNGSNDFIVEEQKKYYSIFNYYLSRHHINDYENSLIFGLNKNKILNNDTLKNLKKDNITLSCTCFKGGIDNKNKIMEYIDNYINIGYKKFMFSNLHKQGYKDNFNKSWSDINIDQNEFLNLKKELKNNGFIESLPIYSTGGYVAYILKKDNIVVTIKEYITLNELNDNFKSADKRTFDLSLNPNGELYENWNQTGNKVDVKNLKLVRKYN